MTGNGRVWAGVAVIVIFTLFGVLSFRKSLTPYVTLSEARVSGRTVQVRGFPDHHRARYDPEARAFRFTMKDEAGQAMEVLHRGPRPGNFDQAESVVAIGRYNGACLESTQLLVKCPSKYESGGPGVSVHPEEVPKERGVRLQGGSMEAAPAPTAVGIEAAPRSPAGSGPQGR